MADHSSIEWTDATWNPIRARNKVTGKIGWHCEHASPGCKHCYAEPINEVRFGTGLPFKPGHRDDIEIFLDEEVLQQPLRWRRPRRIFPGSMTDLFGDWVTDAILDRIFAVMALCPQHTFQVLTKRSARMRSYLRQVTAPGRQWAEIGRIGGSLGYGVDRLSAAMNLLGAPLPNVWLGISAEDQKRADERVPDLLATPAAVRFVSAEPLLGPIVFAESWMCFGYLSTPDRPLDWIIVGGESGAGARPMYLQWLRSIRDQCLAAGVAFFFKQWGDWLDEGLATVQHCAPTESMFDVYGRPTGPRWHFYDPDDRLGGALIRIGKKAAGRLLDGVEHNGMPEARV